MGRPASADVVAALRSPLLRVAYLVEAHFVTGPVYVWSGRGNLSWNGHTWLGVGSLGGIAPIEEGSTVEAKGTAISLSGFDPDLLAEALNEVQQGLPAIIYLALFDASLAILPDPLIAFSGSIDQPTISVDGQTATITLNCESPLVEMNTAVDRRYTNEDQQLDHPGDRGLEFVASIQSMTIYWGQDPNGSNI